MVELVKRATIGAIIGGTAGAPMRGRQTFRKLTFYEPIPAQMAPLAALEGWLVASKHLHAEKSPQTYSQSLLLHWGYARDESAFGRLNLERGLTSPLAGAFENPLGHASESIGRAVYWGLAFKNEPESAVKHAYYDASVDHSKDAVAVSCALARMVSVARPGLSATDLIRTALPLLPKESTGFRATSRLMKMLGDGMAVNDVRTHLPEELEIIDPYDAGLSLAYVLAAVVGSKVDFDKGVLIAAGCGGASDHSGIAAGALLGLLTESDLTEWTKPLGQSFVVGTGLKSLDPPATIQEFVELVTRDTTRFGQPLPEPKVAEEPNEQSGSETGEDETAPTEAKPTPEPPKAPPAPSENLIKLLEHEPNDSITEFGNIRLSVQYLDDPIIQVGQTNRFVFNFANLGEESQELHTSLSAPEGWESKSHLSSFRLEPGQSSAFPVVVKPTKEPEGRGANLKLRLNKVDVLVPMLVSQRWSWIGPFVNHAGAGYERSFPPETEIDPAAVYNGRSDLPVRWQQESFPGVVFDLDSKFRTGPGVIYLYGRLRFESNETLRMVTASPVGVVVWINGERKLWYHDVHEPVPRSEDRYVTEFAPGEEVTILVKVLRNMQPIGPTTIYFLDQSGKVVLPVEFKSIGE